MEKIKIKPCPFCGCEQVSYYRTIAGYYYCCCDQCGAQGPEVSENEVNEFLDEDVIKAAAIDLAADRWNCRPDMTNYTSEDLEAFEKACKN